MSSERFSVSLTELEERWSIDDVEAALTVLEAIEEMQPDPPKPPKRKGKG